MKNRYYKVLLFESVIESNIRLINKTITNIQSHAFKVIYNYWKYLVTCMMREIKLNISHYFILFKMV